jgi:hypothetical protein
VFDTGLAYILWKGRGKSIDLAPWGGRVTATDTAGERARASHVIRHWAFHEGLNAPQKDDLIANVAERLGVDTRQMRELRLLGIMNADEVRSLDVRLADVQEIEDNRAFIRACRPGEPDRAHFCYPSGVTDPRFGPWLREAGMRSATTCVPGLASPARDPLTIPRMIDTSLISELLFEAWLDGTADLIPHGPQLKEDVIEY